MTTNFLVVGGTGKTGRRVADQLRERGLPVRITSRRGAPALQDVDAIYLTCHPDLVPADIRAFAEVAVARGVGQLLLPSGRGEEEAEVGTGWTVLRCRWFAQSVTADVERVLGRPATGVWAR